MPNPKATIDIVANAGPFQASMSSVKKMLTSLKSSMEKVSSYAKYFLAGEVAAVAGFLKLEAEQARAIAAVEAALKSQGVAVGEWSKRLQGAASAMQAVTTHGDETILQLMQLGMSLGVTADQIESLTRGALGLADMFGIGATEAMKKLALAASGNYDALAEMIPALKSAKDQAEKLAIINRVLGEGWQYSQSMAQTAAGQFAQLKNELGDLGENIGRAVMPTLRDLVAWIREAIAPMLEWTAANGELAGKLILGGIAITAFVAALAPLSTIVAAAVTAFAALGGVVAALVSPIGLTVAAITAIGASIAYASLEGETFGEKMATVGKWFVDVWEWARGAVADSIAFIGAAFENWQDALRAVILKLVLNYTSAFEDMKWWMTSALPEYLAWFGRNWSEIFTDIGNFVATVTKNMYDNLVNFFANVWNWLAGDETDWRWIGLTEGFERTLREDLPAVARRELTAAESWLSSEISKSMESVWKSYGERSAEWRRRMGLGPVDGGSVTPGAAPSASSETPTITPTIPTAPKAVRSAGSAFEGLESAYARIANAAAAIEDNPDARRTADNTDALKKLQEEQTRRIDTQTEKLVDLLSQILGTSKQGAVARLSR
jgi:hypothetical protein